MSYKPQPGDFCTTPHGEKTVLGYVEAVYMAGVLEVDDGRSCVDLVGFAFDFGERHHNSAPPVVFKWLVPISALTAVNHVEAARAERVDEDERVRRLEARVAKLEALLRKLEKGVTFAVGWDNVGGCPVCWDHGDGTHTKDCELAALLDQVKP